ncbi:MAG: response regulator transcription factor, partial [Phaeodactylibacter sp.]|nr:response regulator transcription factor [Phaeodactylibacter sp.]
MTEQAQGKLKILLVDDEQDILEFFGYNLSRQGFELCTASSGSEALDLAIREQPDLIVLDIMMPEPDGITICREIKANPNCEGCIILFLTAGSSQFAREAMQRAPADDFLLKPLRPKIFTTKVLSVLQRFGKYRPATSESHLLDLRNLRLNRKTRECITEARLVQLREQEFEILWLLATQPGQVYSTYSIKKALSKNGMNPV